MPSERLTHRESLFWAGGWASESHSLYCPVMLTFVSGVVGMGGYLLQGGISFLSAQYGLAADVRISRFKIVISANSVQSIVEWETVLPNGTIAYINAAKQPDLAVAMRGSGSQFG